LFPCDVRNNRHAPAPSRKQLFGADSALKSWGHPHKNGKGTASRSLP
jgi:hypothetical protein